MTPVNVEDRCARCDAGVEAVEEVAEKRLAEKDAEISALRTERDQALLVVQALGQRVESLRASLAEAAELADSLSGAPAVRALSDRWRASADLPPGGIALRQSIVEGLVEALDEAAASLETASRWGTGDDLAELRDWARSRAECARRALAGVQS